MEVLPSSAERGWDTDGYYWEAPALYRKPTYFGDIPLERHGRTRCECLQPGFSAVRFAGQVALLPYSLTVAPPWKCQYSLAFGPPAVPTTRVERGPCGRGTIWVETLLAKDATVESTAEEVPAMPREMNQGDQEPPGHGPVFDAPAVSPQ
jgi:hypothetical protein